MLLYYLSAYMYIGYFDYRPIVRSITNQTWGDSESGVGIKGRI